MSDIRRTPGNPTQYLTIIENAFWRLEWNISQLWSKIWTNDIHDHRGLRDLFLGSTLRSILTPLQYAGDDGWYTFETLRQIIMYDIPAFVSLSSRICVLQLTEHPLYRYPNRKLLLRQPAEETKLESLWGLNDRKHHANHINRTTFPDPPGPVVQSFL